MAEQRDDPTGGRADPSADPIIECIAVGALAANCYLITCPTTRRMLVVDPGAEAERILAHIGDRIGDLGAILHTHGHFDHIGATEALLAALPAPVPLLAHPADRYLYEAAARAQGAAFGYPPPERPALPDTPLEDGAVVAVGALRLRVVHTPGHTPGGVSLVLGEECIFSGDTLFRRGIGRTDLLGGDEEQLYASITTRLYPLPERLTVYPGHGPATTIGEERRHNPFVRG